MKYLITGGAGFIGSHLCEKLIRNGNEVICLDNFCDYYAPGIKKMNISSLITSDKFKLIEGDIRDSHLLKKIFSKNIDCVIHLAAMTGVRPSITKPELYYDVNVTGTLRILNAMLNANIKNLIFASSSSVYGNNKKIPFSEEDFVDKPISPYAATKRAGEMLCYSYHHLYKFNIFCMRFFTVYGPRQRPDLAIHKFVNKIYKREKIEIYGDGNTARDYTYINDIIDGVIKAIEKLYGYSIYNLGESRTVKLNHLINTIEKLINIKVEKQFIAEQPGDVDITYADISKAKKELGYNPKYKIEDGIKLFLEWKRK